MTEELIRVVARAPGDQVAWGKLYDKLRPSVYYEAYRACRGSSDLARDLVQAAFERLLRYGVLESFESDVQLAAYLRRIVSRLARDELRRAGATDPLDSHDTELAALTESSETDVQLALADIEQLARNLSDADRGLLGKLLAGRTLTQIADEAGISYPAAAVRVHRLKTKLREKT